MKFASLESLEKTVMLIPGKQLCCLRENSYADFWQTVRLFSSKQYSCLFSGVFLPVGTTKRERRRHHGSCALFF
jgi:hypothetical protein